MSQNSFASGMFLNVLGIIGGVVFVTWLSVQSLPDIKEQSSRAGTLFALAVSQIG